MFRMITLMWVVGVALCALPVEAGTLIREGQQPASRPDVTAWGSTPTATATRVRIREKARGPARIVRSTKSKRHAQANHRRRVAALTGAKQRKARRIATARKRVHVAQRRASARVAVAGGGVQTGVASHYWQPQRLASGGWFNPKGMTAAHRTLPFGTKVRVTHLGNGRSVDVTINDRGPYIGGRIIDLSTGAAGVIGMREAGLAKVKVEVLGR